MHHNHNRFSPGTRIDEELIGVLQYVFITQRKHNLGKLASDLNMEYGDLHAFVSGRRTMPITLLKKITEMTGDKIFLDTVFAGSKISWQWKMNLHLHTDSVVTESLEVVDSVGKICETLHKSLDDGKVTGTEKRELTVRINSAMSELSDLLDVISGTKGA